MQLLLKKPTKAPAFTENEPGLRTHWKLALYALSAFALSQSGALGELSPFCAAFAASVPFEGCAACVLGGAIGYFFALSWQTALKYTAALLLISVFRLLLHRRFENAKQSLVLPVIALSSVTVCALIRLAFGTFSVSALLELFSESALAFFCAVFFCRFFKTPFFSLGFASLAAQELAALLLTVCLFLMCGAGFTVGPIAPVRIAAALILLFAAQSGGLGAGCLVGVCFGAALSVDPAHRELLCCYALGGLVCGVFSPFGQYALSVFFPLTSVVCAFVTGMREGSLWCLAELLTASVLFFLLPTSWLDSIRESLKKNRLATDPAQGRPLSAALHRAAGVVDEAALLINEAGRKLDHIVDPELNTILAKLQQNICYGCGFKTACWRDGYSDTVSDILAVSGKDQPAGVKTRLERRCPRAGALRLQIEQSYTDFVGSMAAKEKMKELRGIVGDQFHAVAAFLGDLAEQTADSRINDPVKARTLKTALQDSGIYVDCLQFFTAANGRISIEITMLEDAFSLDQKRMKRLFEHTVGRRFEKPEIAVMDLRTTLTFQERAAFRIRIGQAQIPSAENSVCGDCVRTLTDERGNQIALLSDGMGTGARAAVDAELAASLMEKLLRGGFSFPAALHMANGALLVKSTDETIATLDGVCINVYTGETSIFKSGAAASFLRRGDTVRLLEESSMPLGILREVEFAVKEEALAAGDILLLVSDGVTAGDCGWISDELLAWSTNQMQDLAAHIASLARLRADQAECDDITVVAVKITENREK